MKVYIIGKVTGLDYERCCNLFERREIELKELGYKVVNPVKLVTEGTGWTDAMKQCIAELIQCDGYSALPNALDSKGGVLELIIARDLKLIEIL